MSRKRKQGDKEKPDPAAEAFAEGMRLVRANRALAAIGFSTCRQKDCAAGPRDGLVRVDSSGVLHVHPTRRAEPAEWAWAAAHAIIHLGFGHVPAATGERVQPDRFDLAARCAVVNRFLLGFPVGLTPRTCRSPTPPATRSSSPRAGAATGFRPRTSGAARRAVNRTSSS